MRVESTGFTRGELLAFADEFVDHERTLLADRLEQDSARLAGLVSRIGESSTGDEDWSPREILAHIAVFSKFYGMLTYKVGSGQLTAIDLLSNIQQRDVIGAQVVARSIDELSESIAADHRRTVAYLRSADAAAMKRTVDIGAGMSVSADQIARLFLCAHLEQHIDQLARTVAINE